MTIRRPESSQAAGVRATRCNGPARPGRSYRAGSRARPGRISPSGAILGTAQQAGGEMAEAGAEPGRDLPAVGAGGGTRIEVAVDPGGGTGVGPVPSHGNPRARWTGESALTLCGRDPRSLRA